MEKNGLEKDMTGKIAFIIYEMQNGNGFVKEYNNNGRLIFDGKYLNGEKDGKGKEYDDILGYLIFEGEYLNGKRWNGEAKKYDIDGNRIFKGEYINGILKEK